MKRRFVSPWPSGFAVLFGADPGFSDSADLRSILERYSSKYETSISSMRSCAQSLKKNRSPPPAARAGPVLDSSRKPWQVPGREAATELPFWQYTSEVRLRPTAP